jgi:hypothetical protein
LKVKKEIEKVIDFYWEFIGKNIDPYLERSLTGFLDVSEL